MEILMGIFGLIIGSFLNVLVWRLNDDKAPKFWQGRSICPNCKKTISWFDNIPLLSFILLRGKCRYCHKEISWQYPLVEFITGLVFLIIGLNSLYLTLACVFIVIFFSDMVYGFIPDEMIVVGIIIGVILAGVQNLFVALISGLFFFLIVLLTKFKGMGLGDVKLAFLMGFLLGWPKIGVALWSGMVIGGIYAVGLLLLKKTKLSATIALGPFLIIGLIVSALWTSQILGFL